MIMEVTIDKVTRLYEVAEAQQGVFTTKQAERAGYSRKTHFYQAKAGHWIREHRGIYRLARYPLSDEVQLVIYSLWSRNRDEDPQGVYSHKTVLSINELTDLNPSKLDMTVPRDFRRNSTIPKMLNLHYEDLHSEAIETRRGYRVTRVAKAIYDLAKEDRVSREIIEQAIHEGIRRGLITESERQAKIESSEIPSWTRQLFANSHL